jgi:hypothetical protein
MRFVGDVNGNGATEVEADDVDEAATKLAEQDYESGDGSPPPRNEYLVCLLSIPDYAFCVRCVTIEFQPSFSASTTREEPEEHVFDSLIREARRAETAGTT